MTHKDLLEHYHYDHNTGKFTRLKYWGNNNKIRKQQQVGSPDVNGYIKIRACGEYYMAHRLAWYYIHKKWPEGVIDHINGDKQDNRISNLRDTTQRENTCNREYHRDGSKLPGVSYEKRINMYKARISIKGITKHLDYFKTPEEAHECYKQVKAYYNEWNTLPPKYVRD